MEIKQNSTTFLWYLKMPNVFKEHRGIISEKTIEYQDALKKRIESFRKDLNGYAEEVQEYENWGEIKRLLKYKKKSETLDNR